MNDNGQRIEEEEPTPPSSQDGPQEPVNWEDLEDEQHPTLPEDAHDDSE